AVVTARTRQPTTVNALPRTRPVVRLDLIVWFWWRRLGVRKAGRRKAGGRNTVTPWSWYSHDVRDVACCGVPEVYVVRSATWLGNLTASATASRCFRDVCRSHTDGSCSSRWLVSLALTASVD